MVKEYCVLYENFYCYQQKLNEVDIITHILKIKNIILLFFILCINILLNKIYESHTTFNNEDHIYC